ncbi:MAG TPA: aspartate carbamoyltransferase regulatory subunit [Hadesarchaea archaeon]|nr:aspartate carbamoyltransferase regulatory subunit [Hadesarchaea archaeon]
MNSEELTVKKIRDGTVIDHIPGGQALNVLRILGITGEEGHTVAIMINAQSRKLGKKDIVKIEGRELVSGEVDRIALIAPEATINLVKYYRLARKTKVKLPDEIKGLLKCTNPNCISNKPREPVTPSFRVVSRTPTLLVCEYCGTYITYDEVAAQYTLPG